MPATPGSKKTATIRTPIFKMLFFFPPFFDQLCTQRKKMPATSSIFNNTFLFGHVYRGIAYFFRE